MPALDEYGGSAVALDAPANDLVPVSPHATDELDTMAKALYIVGAGDIVIVTRAGNSRTVAVPANFILPVRVKAVRASGTTATGIWAFV